MNGERHSSRRHRRLDLLVAPGFLAALALLAVNDHVLKSAFPGWVTGKLSDFAGLFAFAFFLGVLHPRRRTALHVLVGVAFIVWKSPLADGVLAAWNDLGIWPMARVIDPTDLIALAVLPVAWWYARVARGVQVLRPARSGVALAAIALFAATSPPMKTRRDGTVYILPIARDSAMRAITDLSAADSTLWVHAKRYGSSADTVELGLFRGERADVRLEFRSAATGETILTLIDIRAEDIGSWEAATDSARAKVVSSIVAPLRRTK